jgi:2-polyprenyl-6-hydroxyphenyl methylase / 3-demethylubiquinone-9 3-methyltransferase
MPPVRNVASRRSARRLSDEELRAIYDQSYVDQYDPDAVLRIRRMLPLFQLTGNETVADFGCGNGVLLELIGPYVHEYVGVDFSPAFVRAAELRRDALGIRNGTFYCADLETFCAQQQNRFDAAFALDFSEHIYDDQFVRIFTAIGRALKPGAPLYVHTPNEEYFMERLRARGILRRIEGHVGVRDARTHEALLAECGFVRVHVRYLPHYLPLPAAFHGLGALPLVGRHFRARLFLTCHKAAHTR